MSADTELMFDSERARPMIGSLSSMALPPLVLMRDANNWVVVSVTPVRPYAWSSEVARVLRSCSAVKPRLVPSSGMGMGSSSCIVPCVGMESGSGPGAGTGLATGRYRELESSKSGSDS